MARSLDITAEIQALRDRSLSPRDLGLLFSMIEDMPEPFAARFAGVETWRDLDDALDKFTEYCDGHGITLVM